MFIHRRMYKQTIARTAFIFHGSADFFVGSCCTWRVFFLLFHEANENNGKSEVKWFAIHSWPINPKNHEKTKKILTFGQWTRQTITNYTISIQWNDCCVHYVRINDPTKYVYKPFLLLNFHFLPKEIRTTIWTPNFTFHRSFFPSLVLEYMEYFWIFLLTFFLQHWFFMSSIELKFDFRFGNSVPRKRISVHSSTFYVLM